MWIIFLMDSRRWALISISAMMACLIYFGMIRLGDLQYRIENPPSSQSTKPFVPPPKPSVAVPEPISAAPAPLTVPVLPGTNLPSRPPKK